MLNLKRKLIKDRSFKNINQNEINLFKYINKSKNNSNKKKKTKI